MKKRIFTLVATTTLMLSTILVGNSITKAEEEIVYSADIRAPLNSSNVTKSDANAKSGGANSKTSIVLTEGKKDDNGDNGNNNSNNGKILPKTGGTSTGIYTLLGSTIVGIGIVLLMRKNREEETV